MHLTFFVWFMLYSIDLMKQLCTNTICVVQYRAWFNIFIHLLDVRSYRRMNETFMCTYKNNVGCQPEISVSLRFSFILFDVLLLGPLTCTLCVYTNLRTQLPSQPPLKSYWEITKKLPYHICKHQFVLICRPVKT